jgi:hypothetical protein
LDVGISGKIAKLKQEWLQKEKVQDSKRCLMQNRKATNKYDAD